MRRQKVTAATFRLASAAGLAALLSGCYGHHLDHRETIGAAAGDAQAVNRIVQMKDPWPAGAWDKTIDHDGTRMVNAADVYHRPKPQIDAQQQAINIIANGPTTAGN